MKIGIKEPAIMYKDAKTWIPFKWCAFEYRYCKP